MAEDFGDADDGEIFGVNDGIASGGAHALATDTEEFERGILTAQRFDELRAIHFSGGFAGRDEDAHGGIVKVPADAGGVLIVGAGSSLGYTRGHFLIFVLQLVELVVNAAVGE